MQEGLRRLDEGGRAVKVNERNCSRMNHARLFHAQNALHVRTNSDALPAGAGRARVSLPALGLNPLHCHSLNLYCSSEAVASGRVWYALRCAGGQILETHIRTAMAHRPARVQQPAIKVRLDRAKVSEEDGIAQLDVRYRIANHSAREIGFHTLRAFIYDADSEIVLATAESDCLCEVPSGKEQVFYCTLEALDLLPSLESGRRLDVRVHVIAAEATRLDLGGASLPARTVRKLRLRKRGSPLRISSGGIWCEKMADGEGVEYRVLVTVENPTPIHFRYVALHAEIANTSLDVAPVSLGPGESHVLAVETSMYQYTAKGASALLSLEWATDIGCATSPKRRLAGQRRRRASTRQNGKADGRTVIIRMSLTKGEGHYPDDDELTPEQRTPEFLRSCMKFVPEFDDVRHRFSDGEHLIESWHLVDDGLEAFPDDYPAPIVAFKLRRRLNDAELPDFLQSVWMSSYRLLVPGVNDKEPFYFEDWNGYTEIIEVR